MAIDRNLGDPPSAQACHCPHSQLRCEGQAIARNVNIPVRDSWEVTTRALAAIIRNTLILLAMERNHVHRLRRLAILVVVIVVGVIRPSDWRKGSKLPSHRLIACNRVHEAATNRHARSEDLLVVNAKLIAQVFQKVQDEAQVLRDSSLGIIRTSPGTTYAIWIDHDDS